VTTCRRVWQRAGRGGFDTKRETVFERIEDVPCVGGFVRMCDDAWRLGWHERNGGNLSYRMSYSDLEACAPFFADKPGAWHRAGVCEPALGGSFFLVTGTGRYMRNVADDPASNVGIVQVGAAGDAWRVVWGLRDGRPTSEFSTHLMIHAVRDEVTRGADRVVYHAHTPNVIAMTYLLPPEDRAVTRALWKTMTECVMVFPEGVGVVPWMVPGDSEVVQATAQKMRDHAAVVWALHGLFCAGPTFDATFGLAQVVEKAAQIYLCARQANGGNPQFPQTISDDGLRAVAAAYGLALNEDYLNLSSLAGWE